jgi:hypothetical protein
MIPDDLNPDRLELTKQDVMEMLGAIIDRWKKNKKDNAIFIVLLEGFKASMSLMPKGFIKKMWSEILSFINLLLYRNGIRVAAKDNPKFAETFEKIKKDFIEGKF